MDKLKDHPLAEIFPIMPDEEIDALAKDIKANGQQLMITLYDGKILDGRNRFRACLKAGVEPTFKSYKGKDPLGYVLGLNLTRRHLTDSQRAMVAAKIANLGRGESKSANLPISPVTQPEAAKAMHVSTRAVTAAKQIIKEAPAKAREIEQGKKTIHAVQKEIKEAAKPKEKPAAAALPKDERGTTLPADKVTLWNRRSELADLAEMVSKVRVAIRKAQENDDPLFRLINPSTTLADLDRVYYAIAGSTPYCVCPMCQGQGCKACKKTGLLGRFQFKTFVPKELKGKDA